MNPVCYKIFKFLEFFRMGSLLIVSLQASMGVAQSTGSLSGKVIDAKSKEPVPFATVFLANTMIGVTATGEGVYVLHHIPVGKYDLIVSSVGYKLRTIPVSILGDERKLDVLLLQEAKLLQEVVIKARHSDYANQVRAFKKYFLGETRNSFKCTIVNIEDVDFDYLDKNQVLKAYSQKPVEVENFALGYHVVYLLKEFTLDFRNGVCVVAGIPRFEPLTLKNETQLHSWIKERERAYYGSLNHFMRSLKFHCLHEDDFTIYSMVNDDPVMTDESQLILPLSDSVIEAHHDLKVVYWKESEEFNYGRQSRPFQTSYLKFLDHRLVIHDNGYFEEPLSVYMQGYLAWSERISQLLPLEYQPAPKTTKSKKAEVPDQLTMGSTGSLSGKVINAITNQPLSKVAVFLANTQIETLTQEDGQYLFPKIPSGRYDLTVYKGGYKQQPIPVSVSDRAQQIDIGLQPDGDSLDSVDAKANRHSLQFMKAFVQSFLGNTVNASKCIIKNADEIDLHYSEESKVLSVSAAQPIEIENLALGYRVLYALDAFTLDFKTQQYTLVGVPWFESLIPNDEAQHKRWTKACNKAYYGSLNHFMRSLQCRCLKKNNFSIFLELNDNSFPIDESSLFSEGPHSLIKLKIVYSKEPEEYNYSENHSLLNQTSYLSFPKNALIIDNNGYYENPSSFKLEGYLEWAKGIAELLPLEFQPTLKHKK